MNVVLRTLLERNVDTSFKKSLNELSRGNLNSVSANQSDIEDVPIEIEKSSWELFEVDGQEKLVKAYKLHDVRHVLYFMNELIKQSEHMNHHPKIILEGNLISVVLYTHDIGEVTERDIELSRFCDELYEDIVYLNTGIRDNR